MTTSRPRALVTGGTGALGSAVAAALLQEGYEVHATVRSVEGAGSLRQQTVTPHQADLTIEGDALRACREVGGPLSALVATIGGFRGGPLAGATASDIAAMIDLNLRTALLTLRAAYPYLRQSAGGAGVVLVGSRTAVAGGAGAAVYSATKAAVVNLALSLSREWLEDGISVNAILPSIIDTPANRQAMPDADFSRWPKPDEIARVAAFLVGRQGRIVSGAAIPVYGRA